MNTPIVLCFSGLDPTGGAGISADIEALSANGCHCAPIITAITDQDTHNVKSFMPIDTDLIYRQAKTIIADMPVAAIKIGMLANIDNIKIISRFIQENPSIPVILDPIITAGGGTSLTNDKIKFTQAMHDLLLPYVHIVTPNTLEATALAGNELTANQCAEKILAAGCNAALITGTHADTTTVINTLYTKISDPISLECERLPHSYHGSGCTLAASLAGFVALGFSIEAATKKALDYTLQTLKQAHAIGAGQLIPRRHFMATH